MKRLMFLPILFLLAGALWAQTFDQPTKTELPTFQPPTNVYALPAPQPRPAPPAATEGRSMDERWELEFHAGGFISPKSTTTPTPLPAAVLPALFTDQEGSYFFGSGAGHANDVLPGFGGTAIVPFDGAMIRNQMDRNHSFGAGFRVSYDFNERWGIEWSSTYNHGSLELTPYARALASATAASYSPAFTAPFQIVDAAATSTATATVVSDEGHQYLNVLTLKFYLRKEGRFIPYLEAGGGLLNNFGGWPSVRLTGTNSLPGSSITETDTAIIHYNPSPVNAVFTWGTGFKWYVSNRWGVRFDVRHNMGFEDFTTRVWTAPVIDATGVNTVTYTALSGSQLRFANDGTSTLNPAAAVSGVRTYNNDSIKHHIEPMFGVFWRF